MRSQFLFILLLGYAVLAWVGGSDTERIVYWSMPVVYILIGKAIHNKAVLLRYIPFILILSCLPVISQRILWVIPDYPNKFPHKLPLLTPMGEEFLMLDLYPYHGNNLVELASLLQYVDLHRLPD